MSEAPRPFTDAEMRTLARYGESRTVESGEVLRRAGDRTGTLFVLESASADAVREATVLRAEAVVASFAPRSPLGEVNLLMGHRAFLTVRVTRPGQVIHIERDALRRLMAHEDALARLLLMTFTRRREHLLDHAAECLEIVGSVDTARGLALRSFLTRMSVPHRWHEPTSPQGRTACDHAGLTAADLPAAFRAQGVTTQVTPEFVAAWWGLADVPGSGSPVLDVAVVGAGPAGMAAAVGCASEGLSTVVVDATGPGGQAGTSSRIENYLGFPAGLSGADLATRAALQALKFGAHLLAPARVTAVEPTADGHQRVDLSSGARLTARTVVLATGVTYRRLGVPDEEEFLGAGLHHAATAVEAGLVAGRPCVVVGGANSAGQAAVFLAQHGCHVTVVLRSGDLRAGMSQYLVDRITASESIDVLPGATVTALTGSIDGLEVHLDRPGSTGPLAAAGVFSLIGGTPHADMFDGERDATGYVLTHPHVAAPRPGALMYETSQRNVFAVGDVRAGSLRRVAAAAGEGASVVASLHEALRRAHQPA
ncbi:thioredoxin reductase (NADPH) [Isoptericola jiangsuensis]|uniref:Thioredoxin reductase (NADPH) n=1 Tax=Isoptericola jiangsuensis TaxID=548579 RepID=A0A2A9EVI1_9MICO|nr:FAD-dependent oxidoreductase [Isoptericola jiangsuensis]PFG43034.1 thioredoxin reductase (NADPH) [Isoptericola jiangsuensis]